MPQKPKNPKVPKHHLFYNAIVLGDSFDSQFYPLNLNKPTSLFPLGYRPALFYVLQNLEQTGFSNVILYCNNSVDQFEEFLREYNFVYEKLDNDGVPDLTSKGFSIFLVENGEAVSQSDVLRDLMRREILVHQSDYLMMYGDTLISCDVSKFIDLLRSKRRDDSSIVFSQIVCDNHTSYIFRNKYNQRKSIHRETTIVHSDVSNIVIDYLVGPNDLIPANPTQKCPDPFRILCDIYNPELVVCSEAVAGLFVDNVDYKCIEDLTLEVLHHKDVLHYSTCVFPVALCPLKSKVFEKYLFRIENMNIYGMLQQDLLCNRIVNQRWETFPLVRKFSRPNNAHLVQMSYDPRHSIDDSSVTYRGVTAVVGKVSIGANTYVRSSQMLTDCVIGERVSLSSCTLWRNVTIGDDSVLLKNFLCDNVSVGRNCVIGSGTVLGPGCIVEDDTTLPEGTVYLMNEKGELETLAEKEAKEALEDARQRALHPEHRVILDHTTEDLKSDDAGSNAQEREDLTSSNDEEEGEEKLFVTEVQKTLSTALDRPASLGNVVIEINSLKHAYNIKIDELHMLLSHAVLLYPMKCQDPVPSTSKDYLHHLTSLIEHYKPVLQRFIRLENLQSQNHFLQGVEECSCNGLLKNFVQEIAPGLFKLFYDLDLMSEEVFLDWYVKSPVLDVAGPNTKRKLNILREQLIPFRTWLEQAEEESD